jgi:AcrR family transcriptional regulator
MRLENQTTRRSKEPAPKRVRDAAATKARLLNAAELEFAAHGYQGARLRNIAKGAGVQPALIHHYFDGKEGLYRSMLDAVLSESSSMSFDILDGEPTFRDIVDGFAGMLLQFNRKYQNLITILRHESRARSSATAMTREVIGLRVLPIVEAVTAYITQQQQVGEVRSDLDPREMVLALMSLTSYPFVDTGFLETCLPLGLINNDEDLEQRRRMAVEVVMTLSAPRLSKLT